MSAKESAVIGRFRCRRCWLALVLLTLAAGAPRPCPAQGVDATATSMAQTAATLSKEGDYDGATSLYLKAYDRSKEPVLLYNAARVQDKKGDLARARELYERYLRVEKDPEGLGRGRTRLDDLLDRIPGRLVVRVEPEGAAVEVDGRAVSAPGPVELKRGAHAVVVRHDGYAPERIETVVKSGEETRLDSRLKPLPGSLAVLCDVTGARVVVNGTPVGTVPLAGPVQLAPGRYVVEVRAPGRERFAATVDVAPGAEVRLPVSLVELAAPAMPEAPATAVSQAGGAPSPVEARSVRVPLSLAFSEGFLRYGGTTERTHVGMEAEVALRFAGAPWLVPGLALAWTVESPANVTIRPGIRWYFGSFPMYVRTAAAAMVTPVLAWAFVAGLGGDVPLWKGGFLRIEMDVGVWSASVVPVDFAVGLGHAF